MSPLVGGTSFWMQTTPATDLPALDADAQAQVCIVGAGLTGLLCAWELGQAGHDVVVVERGRIAASVTGYTTAKLTSQHGMRYARLASEHGADAARSYGQANERARLRIESIIEELGVDARLERRDAYVYASDPARLDALHAEAAAAAAAGLPAAFVDAVPLPFATVGGVRFRDQAQLDPRRLLLPLATALLDRGVRIHEQTGATGVTREGDAWRVDCREFAVRARHVVVATLLPGAGVGSHLRRHLYCHQGYAVAQRLRSGDVPPGIYISCDRPMRSIRTIATDDGPLLQVGGGAHVLEPNGDDTPYDDLAAFAQRHFEVAQDEYRWTTQDYSSADGMPLIGELEPGLSVATGYGGWGLTTAGVAADIVTARVEGRAAAHDVDALFDPTRELPVATPGVVSSHTSSGTDRDATVTMRSLAPGTAAVVQQDGQQLGAYRDPDGQLHVVSAVCTHLGGVMLWDHGDTTWTCPCHGSKFAPDGEVRQGPAKEPLPRID